MAFGLALTQAQLISWLLIPYLAAFVAALLPSLGPPLLLGCSVVTTAIGFGQLMGAPAQPMQLLGPYGVSLSLDALAGWFVLLNGLLFLAVLLDAWQRQQARSAGMLLLVLLGGLNTCFLCTDLISLYVTLEVVGISAFLLILQSCSDRVLWVALRYLLISNTAMTLYLIGAGLLYSQNGSFAMVSLRDLPIGAPLVFVLVGLLTKAGVFVSGLWLPRTHAEAPAEISALLSGVVVTAGALPLLRLATLSAPIAQILEVLGLASALLGAVYGLLASDAKRLLAWSTLSQMGLVVLSPLSGGLLALAHGLAKGVLFLQSRSLPTRDLALWQHTPLPWRVQLPLWLASLSIAGLPPLLGAAAKKPLDGLLPSPWSALVLIVSVCSVALYARLWGAPWQGPGAPGSWGSWFLLGGVIVAGMIVPAGGAWLSTALVFGLGLLLHLLLERLRSQGRQLLPDLEHLQDLIGSLGLVGAGLLLALRAGIVP
jgi:multicomponent Na+:H+ antiporter subunit D